MSRKTRQTMRFGLSVVELLVVLGIITLLAAVLLPSLLKASAQARTVKCMANVTNLYRALEVFRVDHRGRAQLVASELAADWRMADPNQRFFAYERNASVWGGRRGLPWAIAYGPYVGEAELISASDMFEALPSEPGPQEQRRLRRQLTNKFGSHPIYECPSDDFGVNRIWSPSPMYGVLSYGVNEDICGLSGAGILADCWALGLPSSAHPAGRLVRRLEGKVEKVFQPSRVMLMGDIGAGGNAQIALYNSHRAGGPYLEHFQHQWGRLPIGRHGGRGDINVAFVDGHAETVHRAASLGVGVDATANPGYRYSPRVRISPYRPF